MTRFIVSSVMMSLSGKISGQAFSNPGFDKYAYNTRSEVIGAQRYHGTDVSDTSRVYGGRGFGYNYDPIGNRTSASETIGGETLVKTYAANELNQYTAIANPAAVGLRGDATNTAVVTVNGNAASRDNVTSTTRPWHFALPADNANGGEYTFASIVGVVNPPGTNEADIVSTASGSVYAPPQNETLTYDDDGNLLSDGRWQYTWNGENRLICAEEQVCPTNRTLRKVEYAYDHQGRMVWKKISHGGAEAQSWDEEKAVSYLWDNFNIIAETSVADSATNTTYNIWGLDLDGTMQGAGGVGGLLAVVKDSATYIPSWDGNGNVMEYVSDDGVIVAHREYDPFGGTVVYTCQSAITNQQSAISFTHWFSTKPWCSVTSLSEYQYRKYNPVLGRWLSRDPIGEEGGDNVYAFAQNNLSAFDAFGQMAMPWGTQNKLSAFDSFGQMTMSWGTYKDCDGKPSCALNCYWVTDKNADYITGSDGWTLTWHKLGRKKHARAHWRNMGVSDAWVERLSSVRKPTPGSGPLGREGASGAVMSVETRFFAATWIPVPGGGSGLGKTDADAIAESIGSFCICQKVQ